MRATFITLYGAKGGVGTSFLATNLALALAQESRQRVGLVDLDCYRGGSLASFLDLDPQGRHLGTLMAAGQLSPQQVEAHLLQTKAGIDLLAAPLEGQAITPDALYRVLQPLAQVRPLTVIDAHSPHVTDHLPVVFDHSALVLIALTPEINALQQARYVLKRLSDLRYPPERFRLLVNMADITRDITLEDMAEILGRPVNFELPYNIKEVLTSINRGLPLMTNPARTTLAPHFKHIAQHVLQAPPIETSTIKPPAPTAPAAAPTAATAAAGYTPGTASQPAIFSPVPVNQDSREGYRMLRRRVHAKLVAELKLSEIDLQGDAAKRAEMRHRVADKVARIVESDVPELTGRGERQQLIEEVVDEALGFGPLEAMLRDTTVSEIMVNGPDMIYVEQRGKLLNSGLFFTDEKQLRVVIDRIVAPLGRRVDESSPMVDARLPDGSRVNIIIPPLSLVGSSITIRKFPAERMTIDHFLRFGSLNEMMAEFLDGAVRAKLNIFISGGTGSGKTSLLNILSSFIPTDERIVTIEDAAELRLQQEHVITLESRPPNMEGQGAVSIRDLVRNSLRMRPDRIIVGEVRGGEALDMLQAMNTGHDGSLATGHANTPRDALARLETMVLMAGMDLPVRAIREQIASAVNVIVQQSRLRDGSRKIIKIAEIVGMEGDIIAMQDIFNFETTKAIEGGRVEGVFQPSPLRPRCLDAFVAHGIKVPTGFTTF
jgi:pilus assembly protein CpaF